MALEVTRSLNFPNRLLLKQSKQNSAASVGVEMGVLVLHFMQKRLFLEVTVELLFASTDDSVDKAVIAASETPTCSSSL